MSRRLLLILAVLLLLGGAAFLLFRPGTKVEAARPQRGPAVEAVYATGTVEPELWTQVSATVSGRISEILVREGDRVAEGQPLLRLEEEEALARLNELKARAAYSAEEMERQRKLFGQGFASREALSRAQSDALAAQAAVTQAKQKLGDLTVVAPMDGVILRRDAEPGEVVDKQNVLFWIGQPTPLRITAEVDEEDIPRVKVGQPVLIKADAFPDQVLEGSVAQITPKGDPVTKSFRVRVRLPDGTPVMVGMTTEINVITLKVDDALLVPATAVTDGTVFVIDGANVKARTVKVGIQGRTSTQVLEGLSGDEQIVRDPPSKLEDGDRIGVIASPKKG